MIISDYHKITWKTYKKNYNTITFNITQIMNIQGKVTRKSELITVWAKSTEKIELTIEEVVKTYPNQLTITFLWEKAMQANSYQLNDVINVEFNTKTSEHKDRMYNNINGWSIKLISKGSNQAIVRDDDQDIPF